MDTSPHSLEPALKTDTPPERVRLSLTNLTAQFLASTVDVGDLFATEASLIYIPLSSTTYYGSLAGIGFLIGGITGGLTTMISDAQGISYAREMAGIARQQDFGISLQERVKKHHGVMIPRSSIASIELINKGRALRVTYAGGLFELGSDAAAENCLQLKTWLAGRLVGERDAQQTGLGLPPAVELLHWLSDGSLPGKLSDADLERIPSERGYLKGLWMNFDVQKYPHQEAVLKTVRRLPVKWGAAFYKHLEAAKAKTMRNIQWGLAVTALGALALILFFILYASSLLFAGIFIPFFSVPWVLLTNSKLNQIKKLMAILIPK